jgi:hypothetical protein
MGWSWIVACEETAERKRKNQTKKGKREGREAKRPKPKTRTRTGGGTEHATFFEDNIFINLAHLLIIIHSLVSKM